MTALRLLTFPIEETSQVRAHRDELRATIPTPVHKLDGDYNGDQLDLYTYKTGIYKGIRLSRYIVDGAPSDAIEMSVPLARGRGHVTLDVKAGSSSVELGLPDGQLVSLDLAYLPAIRQLLKAEAIRLALRHCPLDNPHLARSISTWYELSEDYEGGFAAWYQLSPDQQFAAITADQERGEA